MSRADIRDRIITGDDGSLTMLASGHGREVVMAKVGGKVVRKLASPGATFSAKSGKPAPDPQPSERNSLYSRAECAEVLHVPIEQAAKMLDTYEIPRNLGYDAAYVRALRDKLANLPVLGRDRPVS
jgi:hypothetical protein